ncbi:hypothetical protein ACH4SP_14205 [Streptomyces sp. NPDC021093]|uniref:hypothetical protein n=1 Tax=Streptomyces sp. NPDC021093 TaxID=3365112 RepID=UPI00379013A1
MVVEGCRSHGAPEAAMALRFISKDPNTDGANCPTAWVDEATQELVFQGRKADEETQAECLESGPIPDYETVVRLPLSMVAAIREACDVAERAAVR